MKFAAILETSIFNGDHSTDTEIVFEVSNWETVEALVKRCKMNKTSETLKIKIIDDGKD